MIEDIFYMMKETGSLPTLQIGAGLELDRDAVLDFRHGFQEACGNIDEITLSVVCKAGEIYVLAGEKGIEIEDEEGRYRGLKKGRGRFDSDKPPDVTLVRRCHGRVWYLVSETLEDVAEEIAELGDGSMILCTDDYTIYDDIDEYDALTIISPLETITRTSSVMFM